ncbi:MAG: carboxymuconolactone decarboxylase family protein [Rickettsia endosymbiont of Sergentomyia squamirostris]|uniref:Carboxymuconolactone decarboxylase family protein n=1 Tax=Candidatus Tisiphia endosymbiont of Sergentomyia squamirostris TaxID=3113639 RepID=A0AAT9G9D3_9RICK
MNYVEISKNTMSCIYKSYESLNESPLDKGLRSLIELRVSQINSCFYCCNLHLTDARKNNVPQKKLDLLPIWSSSKEVFSEKEVIALRWCELITRGFFEEIDAMKDEILQYFSEREIVDITICISIMNALNRIAISLKTL